MVGDKPIFFQINRG